MIADVREFRSLLRRRPHLRRLWLSNIVSLLGDWLSYVAVSVIAIDRGGSALAVGLVMTAHALPVALLSPIAGPLTDRLDRRALLIGAYLGAAVLTVGMWGAAVSGTVLLMQVLLLLRVAVSGLGMTARTAVMPTLVEPSELHTANALMGLTWSVLFAAGVALGGVLAAMLGAGSAILVDAGSFVLAAFLVMGLPALPPPPSDEAPPRPGFRDMFSAWRFARTRPEVLAVLLSKTPLAIAGTGTWVSLNMMAGARFSTLSVAAGLGVMHGVRAIGTGIGPLLPRHWIPPRANLGSPLTFIGIVGFLAFDSPWFFLPALMCWGAGTGHNWVASTSQLQAVTPGPILGRVTSLDFLFVSLAQAVIAVVSGLIIDATGVASAGAWVAVGIGFAAWLPLMRLRARR